MKKNLFVVFSIYLFVVQTILIGILWSDFRFFCLSAINLVCIVFIALLFKDKKQNKDKAVSSEPEKQISSVNSKPEIMHNIHYIQKPKSDKKISHIWFFVISILFGFFIWFWIPEFNLICRLFVTIISAFILFILFGIIFRFKVFRIWEFFVFLTSLLVLGFLYFAQWMQWDFVQQIDFSNSGEFVNNIETNIETNFVSVDADLTWDIDDIELDNVLVDLNYRLTFDDVIKKIIDENNILLSSSKSIKFDYVSSEHIDYPYYNTAYSLGMIGKSINPAKNLFCETYVVMQWLAKKWDIPAYSDIKKAYWDYAKSQGLLPKCEYGAFITLWDIQ